MDIPIQCQIYTVLVCAVIVGTLDHLHRGLPLLNPFFADEITKVTRPMWKIFVCAGMGMGVAYFVTLVGYEPTTTMQALITGIIIVPFVHAGRLTELLDRSKEK